MNDDRYIFLISRVYQRLLRSLEKSLSDAGVQVTPAQVMVLFYLQKNADSDLTALSNSLMLENATVTGLVDRLEKSGSVERFNHPSDRRVTLVRITEKGMVMADKALPIVKRMNQEITKGHTKEEIESFKKVLIGLFDRY